MKTFMLVTGGLGTGGLERISCYVANNFVKRGWKVVILTLLQKEEEGRSFQSLDSSVDVINFAGNFDPLMHKIKAIPHWKKMIKKAIKQYKPDNILAMTFKIGSLVCTAMPKYANRVTVREISDPKSKVRNQFVNKMTEFFCRNIKSVIFQTNWEKICYGKKIQSKGKVVPNPITIDLSKNGTYKEHKFFTLSRLLINQKRQDILIEAFDLFHKDHQDYTLEIYGGGPDKELIQEIINKSSSKDFIKIMDPIPNVHDAIINHRAFLMTSDYEGMSNALLEAYCLGIPCISSDWPGVEDIVTNEEDGLIYKRQDVEELAKQMSRIANDTEFCSKITKTARNRVDRFEQEMIIDKYCEVIINE